MTGCGERKERIRNNQRVGIARPVVKARGDRGGSHWLMTGKVSCSYRGLSRKEKGRQAYREVWKMKGGTPGLAALLVDRRGKGDGDGEENGMNGFRLYWTSLNGKRQIVRKKCWSCRKMESWKEVRGRYVVDVCWCCSWWLVVVGDDIDLSHWDVAIMWYIMPDTGTRYWSSVRPLTVPGREDAKKKRKTILFF